MMRPVFLALAAAGLRACGALVSPRRQVARLSRRAALIDPVETVNAAVAAFDVATTPAEAYAAMSKMYDSLPRDDISLESMEPLTRSFKLDAFRHLAERRNDANLWTDETIAIFKELRGDFDPTRSFELTGFLNIAGFVGGALYLAALFVQWTLPEIFPAAYIVFVGVFAAPFLYAFILA